MYTRRQVLLIKPEYTEGTDSSPNHLNISDTAQAGGTETTIVLASTSSAIDDFYNHKIIDITTSANTHSLREITDYDGASKTATISPAVAAGETTSKPYTILSDALLVRDLTFTPNPLTEVRDFLRNTWSPLPDIITPQTATITFSVELKGYTPTPSTDSFNATSTTGSFGFIPELHGALLGCKMSATPSGTTTRKVEYAPVTDDTAPTVTLYEYKDGIRHKVTGAVGNITNMAWTAGMIAKIDFEFRGIFNSATSTAIPTPNTLSALPPAVKSANFIVGGVSTYVVQEFSATLGNTMADRPDMNQTYAQKGMVESQLYNASCPNIRLWHQHELHQYVGQGKKIGWPIFELDDFNKVEKGGILAGHDMEEKDVFRAFSEFVVKNKLNAWVTYPDWIIQK